MIFWGSAASRVVIVAGAAAALRKVLDRLAFLHALELPGPDRHLHPNRLRQLASRYSRQ